MTLTKTVGAMAMLIGSAVVASAGDACTDVKFEFTNKHSSGRSIKVMQVKYYNKANGKWQTEDVKNKECAYGATCTTDGDNLRDSEGEELTKFRFIFKYKETDGDWSDKDEGGDKVPDDPTCNAGKKYGPFSITG
jgi:hypothetical protein